MYRSLKIVLAVDFKANFMNEHQKQVQKCREHGFAFLLNLTDVIVSHVGYL
jgi:hypothetical protein